MLDDFVTFSVEAGSFVIVTRPLLAPVPGRCLICNSGDLEELRDRLKRFGLDAPEIIEEPGIHLLAAIDPGSSGALPSVAARVSRAR